MVGIGPINTWNPGAGPVVTWTASAAARQAVAAAPVDDLPASFQQSADAAPDGGVLGHPGEL
jgi:hypothetical protein